MALAPSFSLFSPDHGQRRTHELLEHISQAGCPVLIVGEPGTGKRSVVRRMHEASGRRHLPLQTVCCETTSWAELEQSVKSAGTVYLESVSELGLPMQNLLLANGAIGHNSEDSPIILCGSVKPLAEAVRQGKISEDFFYAIAGVTLYTVPLRRRKPDLIAMAEHFLSSAAAELQKDKPALNEEFKDFLVNYSWPGNFTELEAAMRACVLIGDQEIALAALQASMARTRPGSNSGVSLKEIARTASMKAEREIISEVLSTTGGNRKQTARELKISYKALLYKLKRIGIERNTSSSNGVQE